MSQDTWRSKDPRGLDVSAIEHMDRRAITLVRDEGADRRSGLIIPAETDTALIVTLDLAPDTRAEQAFDDIASIDEAGREDPPLVRFCRVVAETRGTLDDVVIAVPGDRVRAADLVALREAVPEIVNRRVGTAKRDIDPRIEKVAGDSVVPVEALDAFMTFCADEFARRGLDAASWGHVSDGNLHPNVLPRSYADVEEGKAAILAIGREAIRLGGAPLAEHGVGRNRIKQQLLRELYGESGIESMREVKRALDPQGKLAPGVLLPSIHN
jgi:D-lactate dehydrogenase (cytochrome)